MNKNEFIDFLIRSITLIDSGTTQKTKKEEVTVYECGNIIRVDIKKDFINKLEEENNVKI